ncbi:MAG: C45 family peptidase [Muribaculaceae bacterium]|nr:C45 family peptidase [Muribaculaceae bacterium]
MTRFKYILIAALLAGAAAPSIRPCTSCISTRGNAILWKHRDTGAPHNFLAHHPATDSTYEYIALHNQGDTLGLEAWIGMNRAGLAIMNTASYNLAPDTTVLKDREGFIMSKALQHCATVDDFAHMLDALPHPLGVQANFGVIDANGGAVYFETSDHTATRYDIAEQTTVVRTNYSHSGMSSHRLGLSREKVARHFLDNRISVSPRYLTDTLSSCFYDINAGSDLLSLKDSVVADRGEFIPRYISTASIAIEAVPSQSGDGSEYIMWTRLGYPPTSETYAVRFDSIPSDVLPDGNGITPAERKADKGKSAIYHRGKTGKYHTIDTRQLKKVLNNNQICLP